MFWWMTKQKERFGLEDKHLYPATKGENAKGNPNGFVLVVSLAKGDN